MAGGRSAGQLSRLLRSAIDVTPFAASANSGDPLASFPNASSRTLRLDIAGCSQLTRGVPACALSLTPLGDSRTVFSCGGDWRCEQDRIIGSCSNPGCPRETPSHSPSEPAFLI